VNSNHEGVNRKMKKTVVGIVCVLILLGCLGGYWIYLMSTPPYTIFQMFRAIERKDYKRFSLVVDTNRVDVITEEKVAEKPVSGINTEKAKELIKSLSNEQVRKILDAYSAQLKTANMDLDKIKEILANLEKEREKVSAFNKKMLDKPMVPKQKEEENIQKKVEAGTYLADFKPHNLFAYFRKIKTVNYDRMIADASYSLPDSKKLITFKLLRTNREWKIIEITTVGE